MANKGHPHSAESSNSQHKGCAPDQLLQPQTNGGNIWLARKAHLKGLSTSRSIMHCRVLAMQSSRKRVLFEHHTHNLQLDMLQSVGKPWAEDAVRGMKGNTNLNDLPQADTIPAHWAPRIAEITGEQLRTYFCQVHLHASNMVLFQETTGLYG